MTPVVDTSNAAASGRAQTIAEYTAVGDQLPILGGRSWDEIEALLRARRLMNVRSDLARSGGGANATDGR
jgi:hypothetical protein